MLGRFSPVVPVGRLALAALGAALVLALALPAAHAKSVARSPTATATLSQVKVTGQTLAIRGRVSLPGALARRRKQTKVAFTLKDAKRASERFTAVVDAKRNFTVKRATKLTGGLSLVALVTIGGKPSGRAISRRLTVTVVTRRVTTPGPGAGSTVPAGSTGTPAAPAPVPDAAVKLVGLFRFDEGVSNPDGSHSGTWFRMFTPSWKPFINQDSRSRDKTYTLLRPGSDGGLRTDGYQDPASPLYDETGVLSRKVVERERFFGAYFTIFTQSTDAVDGAAGLPTPVPEIFSKDGRLSGQTTAWTANWNGGPLFNQGSPKPDGSLPGFTRPVDGTYDPVTRRFTIEWTSQIVGGGFNFYSGIWHLEGTFVPSA